jgi:predicted TIM-barrel fold metal-dependent hydrolase
LEETDAQARILWGKWDMTTTVTKDEPAKAKRKYNYISADSHLEMRTDCCGHWVPEKYKEWVPTKVDLPDGGEGFVIKDSLPAVGHQSLFAGHSVEEFTPFGAPWAGPGTGSPKQRLEEQDTDGVDAEILYPSPQYLRLCRTAIDDVDAYQALIRAWNDWLAQEFCAEAPDRLLGVGVLPVSNVDAAVAELKYCKELGLPTVNLAAFPAGHRYPSDEDDKFWAAALEMNMPLTVHVSMSARDDSGEPTYKYPKTPMGTKWAATDFAQRCYRYGLRGATNAVQMILQGVFDRFPDLKIYFAENQIGWIPLFLQQLDRQYGRGYHWAMRDLGLTPLDRPPSEYIGEHCYWGFFDDPVGIRMLDVIGVDRVMWSTDFPHIECAWPESLKLLNDTVKGLSAEDQWKITAGNAIDYFNLDAR